MSDLDVLLTAPIGPRARRPRAQRRVVEGLVALPLAAGLALGGWSLAGRLDRPAPVEPTVADLVPASVAGP